MNFRTIIEETPLNFRIKPSDKLFFIGSCFASNIGNKLSDYKFNTEINPFGAAYNPHAICNILDIIQRECPAPSDTFKFIDGKLYSTLFSTALYAENATILQEKTEKIISFSHKKLLESDYIFITLGTSWVYIDKESSKIVNNCLKLPTACFERKNMSVEEICDTFSKLFDSNEIFSSKKIIFTVSPIRHIKDGFVENTISKSTLIVAVDLLRKKYTNTYYFPAFEIMNDDLRDYRFFKEDMVHPSDVAINYIFSKFADWLLDSSSLEMINDVKPILNGVSHRPFNSQSKEYIAFCKKMLKNISILENKYPFISFHKEKELFTKYLETV